MDAFELKLLLREYMGVLRKSAADSMEKITQSCYELGRITALIESGRLSRYVSYNEATRPRSKGGYGRGTVDRWIDEGLIEKIKDGKGNSKVRLDRLRLAQLDSQANRGSWFAFHEPGTEEPNSNRGVASAAPSSAKP